MVCRRERQQQEQERTDDDKSSTNDSIRYVEYDDLEHGEVTYAVFDKHAPPSVNIDDDQGYYANVPAPMFNDNNAVIYSEIRRRDSNPPRPTVLSPDEQYANLP